MRVAAIASLFFLTGCTYSVMLNHTEGYANDLVDENQSATSDFKPVVDLPLLKG